MQFLDINLDFFGRPQADPERKSDRIPEGRATWTSPEWVQDNFRTVPIALWFGPSCRAQGVLAYWLTPRGVFKTAGRAIPLFKT